MLYLYGPFHYFNHVMTVTLYSPYLVFIPTIFGVLGMALSATLLNAFNYKMHFIFIWMLQMVGILFWILNLILAPTHNAWIVVPTWIAFAFLVMTRPSADIHILTYTRLQYCELHMGVSYFAELIVLGVMHYFSVMYPTDIFGLGNTYYNFLAGHITTFYVIIMITGIYGSAVIPSKQLFNNKSFVSLLQVKNWINNERPAGLLMPANVQPTSGQYGVEQYPLMNRGISYGPQHGARLSYEQARQTTFVP